MTPLTRLVTRWVPSPLRIPALTIIIVGLVMAILVASRHDYARIIYVDVRGQ